MGWKSPDAVVVPVGAGDAFWGAWKGFTEFHDAGYIDSLPRMIAAETLGPVTAALEQGEDFPVEQEYRKTVAISVGTPWSSYQALKTVVDSGGEAAVAEGDEEIMDMQMKLAALEGIYAEASSTQTLTVVKQLAEAGRIKKDDVVVALLTSTGIKHPEVTLERLPEIPQPEPDIEAVLDALKEVYDFEVTTQPA